MVGRKGREGGGRKAQGTTTKRRRENFPSASGFLSFIAKVSAQALTVPRNQWLTLLHLQLLFSSSHSHLGPSHLHNEKENLLENPVCVECHQPALLVDTVNNTCVPGCGSGDYKVYSLIVHLQFLPYFFPIFLRQGFYGPGWPPSQKSSRLCLLSVGIKGMCYHHLAQIIFNIHYCSLV